VFLDELQGFRPISGSEYAIPVPGEDARRDIENQVLILDDEDRLAAVAPSRRLSRCIRLLDD
jgi:hypothetical protein